MQEKILRMYGGMLGGLVPLGVLVIGLIWLSVAERGGTKPFWACAWLALTILLYMALATLFKNIFIKRYGELL